jgi:Pyrimidine dimer DNA glycosylase
MRLWTIHPEYLDAQGLVAQWREGLLAKKVLEGKTSGHRQHPQLNRFLRCADPVNQIRIFLRETYNESVVRNYRFDKDKIGDIDDENKKIIGVSNQQIEYEFALLQSKLKERNPGQFSINARVEKIRLNGIFEQIRGEIEDWERVKQDIPVGRASR